MNPTTQRGITMKTLKMAAAVLIVATMSTLAAELATAQYQLKLARKASQDWQSECDWMLKNHIAVSAHGRSQIAALKGNDQ